MSSLEQKLFFCRPTLRLDWTYQNNNRGKKLFFFCMFSSVCQTKHDMNYLCNVSVKMIFILELR